MDNKIEKHDLKIQNLARACYTNILSSDCKTLPLIIVTDPNCSLLKTEIKKLNNSKEWIFFNFKFCLKKVCILRLK